MKRSQTRLEPDPLFWTPWSTVSGSVEISHRIDAEEFYRLLDGVTIDNTGMFNAKLQEWEDCYNYRRPHGSLGGHTPYERVKQKPKHQR